MTKLKDASPVSFLGFRFWLDQLLIDTHCGVPTWLSEVDAARLPLTEFERAEHLPYHAVRRRELVDLSRATVENEMLRAGFTATQLRRSNAQEYIERATERELAAWALVRLRIPPDRERHAWCATACHFAFGNGNRSETANICNLGLSRADQNDGVSANEIRNALHSIVRWRSPIKPEFRFQLRVEICEAIAARKLWNDLVGIEIAPGRRKLEAAEALRRSGDLYLRFHEHFCTTKIEAQRLEEHVYDLAKIAIVLLEGRAPRMKSTPASKRSFAFETA